MKQTKDIIIPIYQKGQKAKKTILAIDFDGTLCEDNYPLIGEPKTQVIEYLKSIKEHCIFILWTCRCNEFLTQAIDWCAKQGLTFDYINENAKENLERYNNDCRKIFADYYIDDKGVMI